MKPYLKLPALALKVKNTAENWQDYFADCLGLKKEEWILKTPKGNLLLRPNSVDRWIATENLILDEYKTEVTTKNEYDTVIDIGANIGAATILLANKYKFAKIIAIEPNSDNFQQLKKNIKLSKISKRVNIINAAVTRDNASEVKLFLNKDFAANSTIRKGKTFVKVPNMHIKELGKFIKGKTLLKMDIEGAEHDFFIKDNLDFLKSCESIIFEYHNVDLKRNIHTLEAFLQNNGMPNYKKIKNFIYIGYF